MSDSGLYFGTYSVRHLPLYEGRDMDLIKSHSLINEGRKMLQSSVTRMERTGETEVFQIKELPDGSKIETILYDNSLVKQPYINIYTTVLMETKEEEISSEYLNQFYFQDYRNKINYVANYINGSWEIKEAPSSVEVDIFDPNVSLRWISYKQKYSLFADPTRSKIYGFQGKLICDLEKDFGIEGTFNIRSLFRYNQTGAIVIGIYDGEFYYLVIPNENDLSNYYKLPVETRIPTGNNCTNQSGTSQIISYFINSDPDDFAYVDEYIFSGEDLSPSYGKNLLYKTNRIVLEIPFTQNVIETTQYTLSTGNTPKCLGECWYKFYGPLGYYDFLFNDQSGQLYTSESTLYAYGYSNIELEYISGYSVDEKIIISESKESEDIRSSYSSLSEPNPETVYNRWDHDSCYCGIGPFYGPACTTEYLADHPFPGDTIYEEYETMGESGSGFRTLNRFDDKVLYENIDGKYTVPENSGYKYIHYATTSYYGGYGYQKFSGDCCFTNTLDTSISIPSISECQGTLFGTLDNTRIDSISNYSAKLDNIIVITGTTSAPCDSPPAVYYGFEVHSLDWNTTNTSSIRFNYEVVKTISGSNKRVVWTHNAHINSGKRGIALAVEYDVFGVEDSVYTLYGWNNGNIVDISNKCPAELKDISGFAPLLSRHR